MNKLYPEDRAVHEWYRFVLSFPPHLVGEYLRHFGATPASRVLDPFCGTGTVLVESKKLGIPSVGVEANTMAHYTSKTKTDWTPNPAGLLAHARWIYQVASERLVADGIEDEPFFSAARANDGALRTLPIEQEMLLLSGSISPLPLHKALILLECIEEGKEAEFYHHERLALAKALVYSSSNLHFGPKVGVSKPKADAAVLSPWLTNIRGMVNDLHEVRQHQNIPSDVIHADARQLSETLQPESIDIVITSPPYPNEKDYTRTTRLESVLLDFIHDKRELQALK